MNGKTYFLNMFSDYEPPESLCEAISQAAIVAADLDPAIRKIAMVLYCEQYLPRKCLDAVAKDICFLYGLQELELSATYPAALLNQLQAEDLRDLFVRENPMARGSMAACTCKIENNVITINLQGNGKAELLEVAPVVQNVLREQFGAALFRSHRIFPVCRTITIRSRLYRHYSRT